MADPSTVADRARSNGGGAAEPNGQGGLRDRLAPLGGLRSAGGPLGRVGRGLLSAARDVASEAASGTARRVRQRLRADLDDRDPDWLRERLPMLWLLATIWFRGEVRNLGNIPEKGAVLLVGQPLRRQRHARTPSSSRWPSRATSGSSASSTSSPTTWWSPSR